MLVNDHYVPLSGEPPVNPQNRFPATEATPMYANGSYLPGPTSIYSL